MAKEEKNVFKVVDSDGKEITCEILFTFESEETNKNYMVYTDNSKDEDGNTRVYASIYDPNSETKELLPIETDREWKVVETVLNSIQEEVADNQ